MGCINKSKSLHVCLSFTGQLEARLQNKTDYKCSVIQYLNCLTSVWQGWPDTETILQRFLLYLQVPGALLCAWKRGEAGQVSLASWRNCFQDDHKIKTISILTVNPGGRPHETGGSKGEFPGSQGLGGGSLNEFPWFAGTWWQQHGTRPKHEPRDKRWTSWHGSIPRGNKTNYR